MEASRCECSPKGGSALSDSQDLEQRVAMYSLSFIHSQALLEHLPCQGQGALLGARFSACFCFVGFLILVLVFYFWLVFPFLIFSFWILTLPKQKGLLWWAFIRWSHNWLRPKSFSSGAQEAPAFRGTPRHPWLGQLHTHYVRAQGRSSVEDKASLWFLETGLGGRCAWWLTLSIEEGDFPRQKGHGEQMQPGQQPVGLAE